MVELVGVSRRSFYRFQSKSEPSLDKDMELRDTISGSRWSGPVMGVRLALPCIMSTFVSGTLYSGDLHAPPPTRAGRFGSRDWRLRPTNVSALCLQGQDIGGGLTG
jgi:hypothetical protein